MIFEETGLIYDVKIYLFAIINLIFSKKVKSSALMNFDATTKN